VVFNVDRNLQTFLPYLAITTGSLLVELWRQGVLLRLGLATLVGLQVAWGALAISFGSYTRINSALLLLKSGLEEQSAAQYASYRSVFRSLARVLPPDARVLLHAHHQSLGIDREVLVDWTGHQGLVSYERIRSVAGLARYYRSLGVSHVLYVPTERAAPSLQEELVFAVFAGSPAVEPARFPPYVLLRVPDAAARVSGRHLRALTLGMPGYADGLYDAEQLGVLEALPAALRRYPEPRQRARNDTERQALVAQADAVFMGATAGQGAPLRAELRQFGRVLEYSGQFRLYLRSGGR
jgi:hypothetical protein